MRSPTPAVGLRPPPDQRVDRPDMHTPRGAQWTGTNRPRTYPPPRTPREHTDHNSTEHRIASTIRFTDPQPHPPGHRLVDKVESVAAAMAAGRRPEPSRTRKLSPPAPRVLQGQPRGRAGHRRTTSNQEPAPLVGEPAPGLFYEWKPWPCLRHEVKSGRLLDWPGRRGVGENRPMRPSV
jgi:hypothetical protein